MDVFLDLMISDHDAPYACLNIRVPRISPRFKFLRNDKNFDGNTFINEFSNLPLSLVYATDNPVTQIEILNSLCSDCFNRHALYAIQSDTPFIEKKEAHLSQKSKNEPLLLSERTVLIQAQRDLASDT